MNQAKTNQARKMVAVSLYANGRKVQAFIKGDVDPVTGKTRILHSDYRRMETALGVRRGDTVSQG